MDERDRLPETVGDLMTVDLIALIPDDNVGRARDLMLSLGIHGLPVVNGDDLLGIVTSTDLVDDWPYHEPVTVVMTPAPTTIDATASLAEAAEVMVAHRIHHLLVSDQGKLTGIVSSFDLLAALTGDAAGTVGSGAS